jgi:2-polyprenyl-6-methoxyphenol hydroxylase-like FAD-dependent oxidoreductase
VLVIGAGPAGLIAALQLATNGVPCVLAERNLETTKSPKMDVTNCRSMEILRRLGVAQGLRDVGTCLKRVSFPSLIGKDSSYTGYLLTSSDGRRTRRALL